MNTRSKSVATLAVILFVGFVAAYKLGPRYYNRYRLHQLQGRHVYDEKADVRSQFQAALGRANEQDKRLLVILGGDWCQWCLALDDLMHHNRAVRSYLAAHYVVLKLDSKAARPLDEAWGRPTSRGVPVLIFVDEHGEPQYVQETVSLELWHGRILGHDPKRVLEVLQKYG